MSEFKNFHPIVNFTYFIFVIGFSMFLMHPVCLVISLLCGFTYSAIMKGAKKTRLSLIYMLPTMLITAFINMAFNHEGATILEYLPSGNPLTLEAVVYGLCASVMLISVICWFSCYNEIMTSDKFIYLFGRIIPSLSLIFSMTLRFVPKFSAHLKEVTNSQKCLGCDLSSGSVVKRVKHGLNILSIMITWSLENAVETADSMKSRGYGIKGRTAFSIYHFDNRDKKALIIIFLLGLYIFAGILLGGVSFKFYPSIKGASLSAYNLSLLIAYFFLCVYPLIIEISEVRKWNVMKSKI